MEFTLITDLTNENSSSLNVQIEPRETPNGTLLHFPKLCQIMLDLF